MIYVTALILGVFSSFHCIGMCGPIALATPMIRTNFFTSLISVLSYHFGRIISYSALGIIAGFTGMGFYNSINQKWISIILGILIIVWALIPFTNPENWKMMRNNFLVKGLRKNMGKLFKRKNYIAILSIGLLNGLIPCGMLYIAMAGAVATGKPIMGGWYMLFYGIGTIPLMIILHFSWELITPHFKKRLVKLTPVLVGLVGLLLVLRGLELGIPIISPQIVPDPGGMSVCHSVGG